MKGCDGLDIVLGGGRQEFFGSDRGGTWRKTDDDLVQQWLGGAADRRYVTTAAELPVLAPNDEVLGLFGDGHLSRSGWLVQFPALFTPCEQIILVNEIW